MAATILWAYTYDGFGVSGFESHTAELSLSMPLRSVGCRFMQIAAVH
ncbi:MAG: hypothetical protein ABW166_20220 [Sedimenticola sp.]